MLFVFGLLNRIDRIKTNLLSFNLFIKYPLTFFVFWYIIKKLCLCETKLILNVGLFMDSVKIAVIGAGAAGMLAAGQAASMGALVTVFEKNKLPGRKLMITGKGRCNLTNNCSVSEFISNVPTNPRFLYAAINGFTPADTMDFFESLGVTLKTERGNRVFPMSDKSRDIVDALSTYMTSSGCSIINDSVSEIVVSSDRVSGLKCGNTFYPFDKIIIATGGASYPLTGSTGDGYKFAKKLGIEVTKIKPSLVPLESNERWCTALQGLSLRNVAVKIQTHENKTVYEDFGELMFTHFGVTGPTVLSASSHLRDIGEKKYKFVIDLKPALDEKTLDKRLVFDLAKYSNKNISNALTDLLPSKMISVFVSLCEIHPDTKANSITKEQRARMLHLFKNLTFTVKRTRPIAEAIITSGGIKIDEINPKTMESKKISGLFFAGEVIDVDAYTGGFNLQIAFSTAVAAAKGAASY